MATQPDLVVNPSELKSLAKEQERASEDITRGHKDIDGLVSSLRKDHGRICGELVDAMKDLETARTQAAANMAQVSALLAENLNNAAKKYTKADEQTGHNIDGQVRDS